MKILVVLSIYFAQPIYSGIFTVKLQGIESFFLDITTDIQNKVNGTKTEFSSERPILEQIDFLKVLIKQIEQLAERKINVFTGETKIEATDVVKHITSEFIKIRIHESVLQKCFNLSKKEAERYQLVYTEVYQILSKIRSVLNLNKK